MAALTPSRGDVIVIHRSHVERLAEESKPLRDQLIIDLAKTMGFRTREIATWRREYVDLEEGSTYVLDSKRHRLFVVPLDWRVAQLLTEYVDGRSEGWVLGRLPGPVRKSDVGKPLSKSTIERAVAYQARRAGIPNWQHYNPRLLRCFFAAEWIRQKRSLKALQVIMRHKYIETTWLYVNRIVFWEDLQAEFERVRGGPIERRLRKFSLQVLESPILKQCMTCLKRDVCKHMEEMLDAVNLPLEEVRCKHHIPETVVPKEVLEAYKK